MANEQARAELQEFIRQFGLESGVFFYLKGLSLAQAAAQDQADRAEKKRLAEEYVHARQLRNRIAAMQRNWRHN